MPRDEGEKYKQHILSRWIKKIKKQNHEYPTWTKSSTTLVLVSGVSFSTTEHNNLLTLQKDCSFQQQKTNVFYLHKKVELRIRIQIILLDPHPNKKKPSPDPTRLLFFKQKIVTSKF